MLEHMQLNFQVKTETETTQSKSSPKSRSSINILIFQNPGQSETTQSWNSQQQAVMSWFSETGFNFFDKRICQHTEMNSFNVYFLTIFV